MDHVRLVFVVLEVDCYRWVQFEETIPQFYMLAANIYTFCNFTFYIHIITAENYGN